MSDKKVHYAKTESSEQTYQVFYNRELILESNNIVKLHEHYDGRDLPPVIYFPEEDINKLEAMRTEHSTNCPIKGEASYWSYKEAENGIWSYEDPLEEMLSIKNHYGFDQKKGFRVKRKV